MIYVDIPLGWMEMGQLLSKDDVAKLLKALYGLKQVPRLWQQFLAAALQELGFEPLDSDNCIYFNSTTKVIIITYVDDFLIIAKSIPAINKLKELLASKFSIKELGPV
jgi:Reverse transcriptase (RNA-dependent DNA polymerase)